MMLKMEDGADGFGVKLPRGERMVCLSAKRCVGKYQKRKGMRCSLSYAGKRNFRGYSADFKPWRERWHFFSGKYDGRWRRGDAYQHGCKRCVLYRSGKELIFLDSRVCGRRSLINHPACFHPEKHRVDFDVWVNESRDRNEQEFGISCELDGVLNVDHVAMNWIVCCQDQYGRWNCSECMETGDSHAEPGYVKATFDSKQALLLDHLKPTLDAICYLCSHDKVSVLLDRPNKLGASAVILKSTATAEANVFLIPIGIVKMSALVGNESETARWIHERLTTELLNVQENAHHHTTA